MNKTKELIRDAHKQVSDCCRKCGVERLFLFGSAAREDFNGESDLDFVVEYSPTNDEQRKKQSSWMRYCLKQIFRCKVDLLQADQISRNPYFADVVNQSKKLIYERGLTQGNRKSGSHSDIRD